MVTVRDQLQMLARRIPRLATVAVTAYVLILATGDGHGLGEATDPYQVEVVQTNASLSQRLTSLPALEFGRALPGHEPVIAVDARTGYQRVSGFGAAITDSSAWLIEGKLSPTARQTLMGAMFGPTGIRLNFVKVPIGASDFTHNGRPYTYDDLPSGHTDRGLTHFSVAHDQAYILPALRAARALNPQTRFMATPWTPPAWMKTNHSLSNAGNQAALVAGDYRSWAAYFVKFIHAYAHAGIPIAAVSPQNEPGVGTLYPGLNLPAASEARWISRDLRPALAAARLRPEIYAGDLGWGPTTDYDRTILRQTAKGTLAGLGWHCYFGSPAVMTSLHHAAPSLDQSVDECSPGLSPTPIAEVVISALRNWASTVSLWNLALDPTGGPAELPNHGCKGCSGLATINLKSGAVALNKSYYQLGQASAFVAPGAQRIATGHFVNYRYPGPGASVVSPGLDDVALRNPNGSLVLIAYNGSAAPIRFGVAWRARGFSYTLPAGATATFVWNRA